MTKYTFSMCFAKVEECKNKSSLPYNRDYTRVATATQERKKGQKTFALDWVYGNNPTIKKRYFNVSAKDTTKFITGNQIDSVEVSDTDKVCRSIKSKNICEVIQSDVRKLYLDIDYKYAPFPNKVEFNETLSNIDAFIRKNLPSQDYTRYTFTRKEPSDIIRSVHIYYSNIFMHADDMKNLAESISDGHGLANVDTRVYNMGTQHFCLPYNTKMKYGYEDRIFIPYDSETRKKVDVTNYDPYTFFCDTIGQDIEPVKYCRNSFQDVLSVKKIDVTDTDTLDKLKQYLPVSFYRNHMMWMKLVKQLQYMNLDYKKFIRHSGDIMNIPNSDNDISDFINKTLNKFTYPCGGIWKSIRERYGVHFAYNDRVPVKFCEWVCEHHLSPWSDASPCELFGEIQHHIQQNTKLPPEERKNFIKKGKLEIHYYTQKIYFDDKNTFEWYPLYLAQQADSESDYTKYCRRMGTIRPIREIQHFVEQESNYDFGLMAVGADCGVGKTYFVERAITDRVLTDPNLKIVKITESDALHDATYSSLVDRYGEDKVGSHKNPKNLARKQIILTSMESSEEKISYIANIDPSKIDYVMIDEYRSFQSHFQSGTMLQKFGENVYSPVDLSKFIHNLVKNAKNTLVLDAHLNMAGISRLQLLTGKNCVCYQAEEHPYDDHDYYLFDRYSEGMEHLLSATESNIKIAFACSSKRSAGTILKTIQAHCIKNKLNRKIVMFNSSAHGKLVDTSGQDVMDSEPKRKTWCKNLDRHIEHNQIDILIHTSVFSTGTSINLIDYFGRYYVCCNKTNCPIPRTVVQMECRVRSLSEKKHFVFFDKNTEFIAHNDGWFKKGVEERLRAQLSNKYRSELNDVDQIYYDIRLQNDIEVEEQERMFIEAYVKLLMQFNVGSITLIRNTSNEANKGMKQAMAKGRKDFNKEMLEQLLCNKIDPLFDTGNSIGGIKTTYMVRDETYEVPSQSKIQQILEFKGNNIEAQEKICEENRITDAEVIYDDQLLTKHYFLKSGTGYYNYSIDAITDNWNIFEYLISNELFINTIKKNYYAIQDISFLQYDTRSEYDTKHSNDGNQFIDNQDTSIGRRKIINQIVSMFGGSNGTFIISDEDFSNVIKNNIGHFCEVMLEYDDKDTCKKIKKTKIDLMQDELGVRYKKSFSNEMDPFTFVQNFKSFLKQIDNFTCGYLESLKPVRKKIDADAGKGIEEAITWSFGRDKHANRNNTLFYFTYSARQLFSHSNIRVLENNTNRKIITCGKGKFLSINETGEITTSKNKPYTTTNNKRFNNRHERARIKKVLSDGNELHEYKLNTYTPVIPASVENEFKTIKVKCHVIPGSIDGDGSIRIKTNIFTRVQQNVIEPPQQDIKKCSEITIHTTNKPYQIGDVEVPEQEAVKFSTPIPHERLINPRFTHSYNSDICGVLAEVYKLKSRRYIKLFTINKVEYFVNAKYYKLLSISYRSSYDRERFSKRVRAFNMDLDIKKAIYDHHKLKFEYKKYRNKYDRVSSVSRVEGTNNEPSLEPIHTFTVTYNSRENSVIFYPINVKRREEQNIRIYTL